jgi:prophage regulatory protein
MANHEARQLHDGEFLITFLRLKQVKASTGMSRSWIYDAIRRGAFPTPTLLGARAVGWDSRAVVAWQRDRLNSAASRPA